MGTQKLLLPPVCLRQVWGRTQYDIVHKRPCCPSHVCRMRRRTSSDLQGCILYKNLQQAGGKIHHPIHPTAVQTSTPPADINDAYQFPPLPRNLYPVPAPASPPTSYSRIVTHHQQPIDMTEQLFSFLNEFKTMFSQLIQQNGMILNMISTVTQKLVN